MDENLTIERYVNSVPAKILFGAAIVLRGAGIFWAEARVYLVYGAAVIWFAALLPALIIAGKSNRFSLRRRETRLLLWCVFLFLLAVAGEVLLRMRFALRL